MKNLLSNTSLRVIIFLLIVSVISTIEYMLYMEGITPGPVPGKTRVFFDALFPFYWFSIGAFIGGLILLFSPAALQKKFTKLVLWWIPITAAIIVLFNFEPSGGKFGISFPDPFAPEPLALFSGILLSLTLTVRLITHWIKKALKK